MKILFEDENIVVCVKPAGVLSQSGEGENMVSLLAEHTGTEIYPVHRLDRETAGVMVFAKNSRTAAELSKQVSENRIDKRYYAVLKGVPETSEGVLNDLLFRDKQKNKTYVVKRMRKGVRGAELDYAVIGTEQGLALADVHLHTGRTHQIRVQFASRKLPLYGDGRYGGGDGKLALFAYSLEFYNPVNKEKMKFTAKPDTKDFPWNLFEAIL